MTGVQTCALPIYARAYRESSLLVEIFTRRNGRRAVLAKGAKRAKSPVRGLLTPFQPLLISCRGRGELAILTGAEADGRPAPLGAQALFCGLYLNELLVRLLHRYEAHERLYAAYVEALAALSGPDTEAALRCFEKHLLQELGYALILDRDVRTGEPVRSGRRYRYLPWRGPVAAGTGQDNEEYFDGATLIGLARGQLNAPQCLREAKQLMRRMLDIHLDGRVLHSRRLARQIRVL